MIQRIYDESNQIFGAGKIMAVLKERDIKVGEKTVRILMQDMGIKSIRQEAKSLYDKEKKEIAIYCSSSLILLNQIKFG